MSDSKKTLSENKHKLNNGNLPREYWRDFFGIAIKNSCPNLSKKQLNQVDAEKLLAKTSAQGSIQLTDNFRLISCPCQNKTALCAIIPFQLPDGSTEHICSGPIMKEKKLSLNKLLLDLQLTDEVWEPHPPDFDCPYSLAEKQSIDDTEEAFGIILNTLLREHSDYTKGEW